MSTALYVLAAEYRQAADMLAEYDLDEQTLADTLESLSGELETKAVNMAMLARNLEAAAEQVKHAEAEMSKRRKAMENRAARIRQYLLESLRHADLHKIDCPYFRLSVRKNPPSVVINEAQQIPAKFMRQPEPPPLAPDKQAISEALKAGEDVPGARLVVNQSLQIK